MPEINVTTSADLKGFRELEASMDRMLAKSKQISEVWKGIGAASGSPSGGSGAGTSIGASGPPHAPSSMSQQHRAGFASGQTQGTRTMPRRGHGSQGYNLGTSSGVISYYENVLSQAMPMINGMARGGAVNLGGLGRVRYTPSAPSPNDVQIRSWFDSLKGSYRNLDAEIRKMYLSGVDESIGNSGVTPSMRQFYNQYGAQLGAPSLAAQSQSRSKRFARHFVNNAQGHSFGSILMNGVKGGLAGSLLDSAMGGGAAGGAAGTIGAGVVGGMLGSPLTAVAAIGIQKIFSAVGNLVNEGVKTFQQTVPAFSALSHALDNATNSAEGFRYATELAGANVAMTPQQSTQAAQIFAQSVGMGAGGMKGLTRLVSQAGQYGMMNGINPTTMASLMGNAATLGITNGAGSSMTSSQFNQMLLNMTSGAHMQGRQLPFYTGLMSVYNGLGAVNPVITSANPTAAIYSAMNATGIQGLQGQNGANILSRMNGSLGTGQGLAGIMSMAAIYQASNGKITNPWQMLSISQQGLGAKVGGTTLGTQLQSMVKSMAPGNIFTQAGILASITGISENQALQMLKSGAMGAQPISEYNAQSTRYTTSDFTTAASNRAQVTASGLGYAKNLMHAALGAATGTPTQVGPSGPSIAYVAPNGNGHVGPFGARFPMPRGNSGVGAWTSVIQSASKATGVPMGVIAAIMQGESSGNQYAGSLAHAYGLMQLEPGIAGATNAQRANPASNVLYGAKYLGSLYKQFGGNWGLAAAAYYAGPGAIKSHVPSSAYSDSLQQLAPYLDFTPAGNHMSVEQYATNFEARATGSSASQVVTLSSSTIQQLISGIAMTIVQNSGKGPSR